VFKKIFDLFEYFLDVAKIRFFYFSSKGKAKKIANNKYIN